MADDKKEGSKKEKSRAAKWVLALFVWGFSAYFLICLSAFIPTTIEAHHAEEPWRAWQKGYIDFLETSYARDDRIVSCRGNVAQTEFSFDRFSRDVIRRRFGFFESKRRKFYNRRDCRGRLFGTAERNSLSRVAQQL